MKRWVSLLILTSLMTSCSNINDTPSKKTQDLSKLTKKASHDITDNIKPVSLEKLNSIGDVSNYLSPVLNGITSFNITDKDKNRVGTYEQVVTNPIMNGSESGNYVIESIMEEYPSESKESLVTTQYYTVTSEEILEVRMSSNLAGEQEKKDIIISNSKNTWLNAKGNLQYFITSIDKTLKTSTGTFNNCIEVTETTLDRKEFVIRTYAPNIGLIHETVIVNGELYLEYSLLNYCSSHEEGNISEENESNLEKNEDNQQLQQLPAAPVIKKVSRLNMNDYAATVNQYSLNQVDYYILHRPSYQELSENEYVHTFVNELGEIEILTDKEALIKEIIFKSNGPLGEEGLLYMKWLILGLNSDIKHEEAKDILFDEPSKYYEIAEFKAGLESNPKSFKLVIFPK